MSPEKLQRVLVIDDEPDILTVIHLILRARGGFEVELCASGGEALGAAQRFSPDLILLDVMMPGIDGPAALEALRGDPQTAATPVVFMTAKAMPNETAHYLDLGAAAVIAKPFDQKTLAAELEQIVRRTRPPASEAPDPELVALLDAYAEAIPAKIQEIRELWALVESGSDSAAERSLYLRVHSLAGTAATYGFASVSAVARQLEQVIVEGTAGGAKAAPELIDALDVAARSGRTTWTTD